jgi:putative ABC transport system ATP-binding protein
LPESRRARLRRAHIGYVFQAFRLFRALSALDNVVLAVRIGGQRRHAEEKARDALRAVGLAGKALLKPHELSGGEKQRVAIARVLVNDQAIVLADEPTASLDTVSGLSIAELLMELAGQGRIVVAVSHDPRLQSYCNRVVTLRDGAVVEDRQ